MYSGHEVIDVLRDHDFGCVCYYYKNEVDFVLVKGSINGYLLRVLPERFNINGQVRLVGIVVEADRVVHYRINNHFYNQYLRNPLLINFDIDIERETYNICRLHELSLEYMQDEMYEYLFDLED